MMRKPCLICLEFRDYVVGDEDSVPAGLNEGRTCACEYGSD